MFIEEVPAPLGEGGLSGQRCVRPFDVFYLEGWSGMVGPCSRGKCLPPSARAAFLGNDVFDLSMCFTSGYGVVWLVHVREGSA